MNSLPKFPVGHKVIGVYCLTCIPTGEKYVGASIDIRARWQRHASNSKSSTNTLLDIAFQVHGKTNFMFEILEDVGNTELLPVREQFYISSMQPDLNVKPYVDPKASFKWSVPAVENRKLRPKLEVTETKRLLGIEAGKRMKGSKRDAAYYEKMRPTWDRIAQDRTLKMTKPCVCCGKDVTRIPARFRYDRVLCNECHRADRSETRMCSYCGCPVTRNRSQFNGVLTYCSRSCGMKNRRQIERLKQSECSP